MKYPENDTQFEEVMVTKVIVDEKGYDIGFQDGWWLAYHGTDKPPPEEGSYARVYSKGMGYMIRGLFCGNVCYYYRTEEEDVTYRQKQQEALEGKKKEAQEKYLKEEFPAAFEKLPELLQKRVNGFRERNAQFDEFLGYEMFVCQQAAVIAKENDTPDLVEAFSEAPLDTQRAVCPDLSDDHSGNTFGAAVRIAHAMVGNNPDNVFQMHGGLCPLVGCVDYGCWAASEEAEEGAA